LITGPITALYGRLSGIYQVAPVQLHPHLITNWAHPSPIPNCISTGSAVFAQLTADSRYTSQRADPFPLKIDPSSGSLGQPESSTQMASQSVQSFLHGSLLWQTDRPTDRATRSVTIGRIYVR